MPGPLAKLIRSKYPGQYDDMDDASLEKAILAKYPDYADLAEPEIEPITGVSFDPVKPKVIEPEVIEPEIAASVSSEIPDENNPDISQVKRIWDEMNAPLTDAPSRAARSFSEKGLQPLRENIENPFIASVMGFQEGAMEGLGDVASSLTSPLNLIATLLSGGSGTTAKAGLTGLGRALGIGGRIASAPVAGHGAINLAHPDSTISERLMGLVELAGGAAGTMQGLPKGKLPEIAAEIAQPRISRAKSSADIPGIEPRVNELLIKARNEQILPEEMIELRELTGAKEVTETAPIRDNSPFQYEPEVSAEPILVPNQDGTTSTYSRAPELPSETPLGQMPRMPRQKSDSPFTPGQQGAYTAETVASDIKYLTDKGLEVPPELLAQQAELGTPAIGSTLEDTVLDNFNRNVESGQFADQVIPSDPVAQVINESGVIPEQPQNFINDGTDIIDPSTGEVMDMSIPSGNTPSKITSFNEFKVSQTTPGGGFVPEHALGKMLNEIDDFVESNVLRGHIPDNEAARIEAIIDSIDKVASGKKGITLSEFQAWEKQLVGALETLLPKKKISRLNRAMDLAKRSINETAPDVSFQQFADQVVPPDEMMGFSQTPRDRSISADMADKRRLRLNRDNTYTDLETGEVLDLNSGQGQIPPEIPPELPPEFQSEWPEETPWNTPLDPKLEQSAFYLDHPQNPDTGPISPLDPKLSQKSWYFDEKQGPSSPIDPIDADIQQIQLGIENILNPPKFNFLKEGFSGSKAIMSTIDLPPLRQGLPSIATKAWWTSWDEMLKAYGSADAFKRSQTKIKNDPLFRNYEAAGGAFTDQITNPEDQFVSALLQKNIPGTNFNPLRGGQRGSIAYLNQLRFDNWKAMYKAGKAAADLPGLTPDEKLAINPAQNEVLAKQLADFVNDTSGRGSLDFSKTGEGKANLERVSGYLNSGFWSPHLISSRVRLFNRYLNPVMWARMPPPIRKATAKSLLGVAAAWAGTATLASQIPGVSVTLNPTSADFGKVRIGNFRQDFSGAFQPYIVAAAKLASGLTTSTMNPNAKPVEMGQTYGGATRESTIEQFAVNKTAPFISFAYDLLNASKARPFNMGDRTLQLVTPMMAGDTIAVLKENPWLIPMLTFSGFGASSQIYGGQDRGEGEIIPKKWDWQITGGSPW